MARHLRNMPALLAEGEAMTPPCFTDEMTSQQRWELELQTKEDVVACSRCRKTPESFGFLTCEPCRTLMRERGRARAQERAR